MTGSAVGDFSVRRALILVCTLAMWGGTCLSGPLYAQTGTGKATKNTKSVGGSSKATNTAKPASGSSKTAKPAKPANESGKAAKPAKPAKPASEPGKGDIRAKRSELKDVERRLGDLQRDLEKTEAQQTEATRAVAEVEREVSKAARALRQVMSERAEATQQLAELETEQQQFEERIAARQNELGEWLRRNYMYGAANDIAALLAARDPNQFVRDTYYIERLGRARFEMIEGLRGDLQRKTEQAEKIAAHRKKLVRLEDDRRKRQETQEETYARRRETLEKIETTLKTQKERITALKAAEERLAQIIKQAAEAEARAAAAAKRARANARTRQNSVADRGLEPYPKLGKKSEIEPVIGKVREVPETTPGSTNFAQLRGKLNFPVAGELLGKFGAPRAGQGTTWRGVFIRAPSGVEVRAVCDGAVIYSDWLRGYGNLLIVDHGGGYLSIYGNNDALYKETGDAVRTGEAIASVGTSGSEPESGLYFEIRHQGQAIDPMQWVRLK